MFHLYLLLNTYFLLLLSFFFLSEVLFFYKREKLFYKRENFEKYLFPPSILFMKRCSLQRLLQGGAPPAVYCSGLNYMGHARETGMLDKLGSYPIVTMKSASSVHVVLPYHLPTTATSTVHGDLAPDARSAVQSFGFIDIPACCQEPPEVDYEGELAIVISERCKNVPEDAADRVILGYCCALDITARRWQGKKGGNQWVYSKSFDTFCPLCDDVARLQNLAEKYITTHLNGQLVQCAPFSDLIFSPQKLVSFLSQGTTLEKGTVILTGTPSGVGYARKAADGVSPEPRYLRVGDVLTVTVDGLAPLTCTVRNAVA